MSHYPLAVFHGHFPDDFEGFRTEPPDPNLKPDYSERFHLAGYNRIQQEEAYKFYQQWISPDFPRLLIIEIQHANPFYDDSYAVNSANLGPYGDAIETELIPYIEKQFRGIGQGWARFLYGGSTGGWEALAVQMFYPDHYNGAFAACPDPVDFRAYTVINLYKDKNAYFIEGAHKQVPQPAMRDYLGHVTTTQQDINYYELALGSHGRSGEQWDIWQAVYSPVGEDGYPAANLRQSDRRHRSRGRRVLARALRPEPYSAARLGHARPEAARQDSHLRGQRGYLLSQRRRLLHRRFSEERQGSALRRRGQIWRSRRALLERRSRTCRTRYSRLHYNTMYLPKMLDRMEKTAPPGADLTSWRY